MKYLISIAVFVTVIWLVRYCFLSFLIFLKVRLEGKKPNLQDISSLREDFIHEGKKNFAGLSQILDSLKRGEKLQSHLDYFKKLLSQLNSLLEAQKENLLRVSDDILAYGKIKSRLVKIEKRAKRFEKKDTRLSSNIVKIRVNLRKIQDEIETTLNKATERFSFKINEAVKEAVKTVRIEKSDVLQKKQITIEESYPEGIKGIRLPYYALSDWHKLLANAIRNAVESIELRVESKEKKWVRVSVNQMERDTISIIIEDSGKGMDEKTRSEFFKRGFTQKDTGLGLGVTEESVDLVNRYGSWQVESEPGKGTKIEIKIEKDKVRAYRIEIEGKRTILQTFFPTPARAVLTALLIIIIGLVILFSVDKYSRFWVDWNPYTAEVKEGKLLIVYNKKGNELWRKNFKREINVVTEYDQASDTYQWKPVLNLADINLDGKNEIFLGLKESESETGYLLCLDYRGSTIWKFLLGRERIYERAGGEIYGPANKIFIEDIDQDGEKELVSCGLCKTWFPCQIFVLSRYGELEREYWHSGHVSIMFIKDIDEDGEMEIVCGGVNNWLGPPSPVLFVLNGKNLKGQSPPYLSKVLPKGKEEIYIKIPRIIDPLKKIGMYPQAGIYYDGKREGWDQYGVIVTDYQELKRFYLVNQELKPLNLDLSGHFYDEWFKLRQRGLVDCDITPEVIEKWKKFERWENGEKVK